jgi:hypothetical protein
MTKRRALAPADQELTASPSTGDADMYRENK